MDLLDLDLNGLLILIFEGQNERASCALPSSINAICLASQQRMYDEGKYIAVPTAAKRKASLKLVDQLGVKLLVALLRAVIVEFNNDGLKSVLAAAIFIGL